MEHKAVIYTRVSSDDQVNNYSIAAQEAACRKYAKDQSAEVLEIFSDPGKSAKSIENRPGLQAAVEYAIAEKIDWIIVWALDRFSRNLKDQLTMTALLAQYQIRLISATENNDESSTGRLMRNILGSFAQFNNEERAAKTLLGMKQAVKEGRYVFPPPIGYEYRLDEMKKKKLYPTKDAAFVKRVFELASQGIYSVEEIYRRSRHFTEQKVTRKVIDGVLGCWLYAGMIQAPWFKDLIQGIHEPLVDYDTFLNVYIAYKQPAEQPRLHQTMNPDFPLKGTLHCPKCGSGVSGYWATGRLKKYAYYRCLNKKCLIDLSQIKMHQAFKSLLQTLELKPIYADILRLLLIDLRKERNKDKEHLVKQKTGEISMLEAKKKKLISGYSSGLFTEEDIKQELTDLKVNISVKTIEKNEILADVKNDETQIEFSIHFLKNLVNIWEKGDLDLKLNFAKVVFPEGIIIEKDGSVRTALTIPIFNVLSTIENPKSSMVPHRGCDYNQAIFVNLTQIYELRKYIAA